MDRKNFFLDSYYSYITTRRDILHHHASCTSHCSWATVYSIAISRAYAALLSYTEDMLTKPCHGWWISNWPMTPALFGG